jgi:hypothetical protein
VPIDPVSRISPRKSKDDIRLACDAMVSFANE